MAMGEQLVDGHDDRAEGRQRAAEPSADEQPQMSRPATVSRDHNNDAENERADEVDGERGPRKTVGWARPGLRDGVTRISADTAAGKYHRQSFEHAPRLEAPLAARSSDVTPGAA